MIDTTKIHKGQLGYEETLMLYLEEDINNFEEAVSKCRIESIADYAKSVGMSEAALRPHVDVSLDAYGGKYIGKILDGYDVMFSDIGRTMKVKCGESLSKKLLPASTKSGFRVSPGVNERSLAIQECAKGKTLEQRKRCFQTGGKSD